MHEVLAVIGAYIFLRSCSHIDLSADITREECNLICKNFSSEQILFKDRPQRMTSSIEIYLK